MISDDDDEIFDPVDYNIRDQVPRILSLVSREPRIQEPKIRDSKIRESKLQESNTRESKMRVPDTGVPGARVPDTGVLGARVHDFKIQGFPDKEIQYSDPIPGDIWIKFQRDDNWLRFPGTIPLDSVAKEIACKMPAANIATFVDYLGVGEHIIGKLYPRPMITRPQRQERDSVKISFTNPYLYTVARDLDLPDDKFTAFNMLADIAEQAQFVGTIILTEMCGARGKAALFCALSCVLRPNMRMYCYEGTEMVLDDLSDLNPWHGLTIYWVRGDDSNNANNVDHANTVSDHDDVMSRENFINQGLKKVELYDHVEYI
jgi:hypothetical protein